MMDFAKTIVALALVLLAIVPVLVRGGQLIASFMAGSDIPKSLAMTAVALLALLLAAALAAGLSQGGQQVLAALVLAALPWAAHIASQRFVGRNKDAP